MLVEIDPLSMIVSGKGVPCLRYHHNKVKMRLLAMLPRTTLLDIGSGVGGDLVKWKELDFSRIYAVDPETRLRRRDPRVTYIRFKVQNIASSVKYESAENLSLSHFVS
jgi:precorrin-6B methylase 2